MEQFKALTIAGSDTSGAAGMEADLKTFEEFGVFGMVALTVIVAQNPQNWAHDIFPLELSTIERQIATVGEGIGVNAIKTGMLGSAELVELVVDSIKKYNFQNVVIDPVMVCKGIDDIMVPEAARAIKEKLVRYADVITPNTTEAAYLSDMEKVTNLEEIKIAAQKIHELGAKNVIVKSGSRFDGDEMVDVLFDGKEFTVISHPKIENAFNSGAGCTFSAAITSCLAKNMDVKSAFYAARLFMAKALEGSFAISKFHGGLAHWKNHIE